MRGVRHAAIPIAVTVRTAVTRTSLVWALVLSIALTPGALRPLSTSQVCRTRWSLDRRHVTLTMKRAVAAAYGVRWADRGRYEFDHLIPRELGGADAVANLWPQRWPDAKVKDREENRLHRAVCAGQIPLGEAQERMRAWPH